MFSLSFMRISILILIFALSVININAINEKPNIIIIMADDMGFDDVSFRGSKEFLTPNIDAMAYYGKILNQLYAPPICTPSRSALMTGRYPIHTGMQRNVILNEEPWGLPLNVTTIGEVFQRAGYSTNLVGKWHLGFASKEMTPTYRGFDYHYGYWGGVIDYYRRRGQMPSPGAWLGYDFRRNINLECDHMGDYVTDIFTNEAESIIRNWNNSKPLFMMLNHLAPHAANADEPFQAPADEIEKFNYIPDLNHRTYAAMISKLDQSIGRIIRALHQTRLLENSIIIFYSDNGAPSVGVFENTGSNWPLRGQKDSPWEGGVRVAGAIWSPLIHNRASIFEQPMYIGDFLPTLAAAAGITLDDTLQLDGINLWPQLRGHPHQSKPDRIIRRDIVHYFDDLQHVTSYLHWPWKYVNGTTGNGTYDGYLGQREFFNVDPRNAQYANVVLQSETAQALRKYEKIPLTAPQIKRLRYNAEVKCGGVVHRNCDALKEECLFNIERDPCEENNLASLKVFATQLQQMRQRVEHYRAGAWEPRKRLGLNVSDPARHNCAWANYLDDAPTMEILSCNYFGPPCGDTK